VTRSLRLRFFLITWPLIVVAVAGVALAFARWTDVRLTSLQLEGPPPTHPSLVRGLDSLTRAWAGGATSTARLSVQLSAVAARDSVGILLLGDRGEVVARTDPQLELAAPMDSLPRDGLVSFVRTSRRGAVVARDELRVSGRPVMDAAGATRGMLFVLPPAREAAGGEPAGAIAATLRAEARRTLWGAFLVASALAAALALLLAGPLVGQVGRLATAAARVRGGDFAARVATGGTDELGRLEHAFNEMAATLERAERHKRNLVHDVAHELRTPLTNVVGVVEALEDGLRVPDAPTLALLRSEAGLLTALVNDLQDLSLAESGQLGFERAEVDVVAEAESAIATLRDTAGSVALEGPGRGPLPALADARRLRQVLRNLLRNALAHTPPGGRVQVLAEARGREVRIVVRDTGRGIPAAHLPLVWERFHRVDPARDRAGGGRGLGLAIVKQFVEGMGGRVAASSVEGEGSTFEVWLPAG
jgi:signal transduction histidine kinase